MTGAETLDMILARCGRSGNTAVRAAALLELKLAQAMRERAPMLPWFLVQHDVTLNATTDTRNVAVPTGFLREVDEVGWRLLDDNSQEVKLEKKDYDELYAYWKDDDTDSSSTQMPMNYALVGTNFYLFPLPKVDRNGLIDYYKSDTVPADDTNANAWLTYAPDLLIADVGIVISTLYIKDPDLTTLFTTMQEIAWNRLVVDTTARAEANRSRSMG